MAKLFTEEELAELRRADEELDEAFRLTPEDLKRSRQLTVKITGKNTTPICAII